MKFPAKDEVLAVLYDNGAIRGEMVLTGRETIDRFPAAAKFQLHFRKTNLSDLGYHPTEEYQHLRVLGSEAPGIAPVALGHTQCILLTEFIPGKSLLALSPFSFPRANPGKIANPGGLWAAAQAAYDAAEELHGAGWVHGDLHLDNILITGEGKARIIDFESLRQPIIPVIFLLPPATSGYYNSISIKVDGNNIQSAVSTIADTWHKYLPDVPFDYTFVDQRFQKLYQSEQQEGQFVTIFSCLAIFIACLGLFGLSAFAISQRVKEIGVRKVLGASISQIVMELSKDFLKLVFIAGVIALPVAWWAMHKWLQTNFAFRVGLAWWVFILAGVIAVIIAFVTISFQAIKAANANPVKSLRSE